MTREYLVDGPVPEGKAITVGQQIAATQVHIQIALAFRAPGTEVHPNHFQINARCRRAVVQDSRSPSDSRGQPSRLLSLGADRGEVRFRLPSQQRFEVPSIYVAPFDAQFRGQGAARPRARAAE